MRSTASQALPRRAACRRPAASRGPRRVQAREAPRSRPVSLWGVVSPGLNWSKMFHRSAQARASALARATGGRSPPRVLCARVPHPSLGHVPHPSRGHVPCRLPVTSPVVSRPRPLPSRGHVSCCRAEWRPGPLLLSRPPVVLTRIVSCPPPPAPRSPSNLSSYVPTAASRCRTRRWSTPPTRPRPAAETHEKAHPHRHTSTEMSERLKSLRPAG